MNQDVARGDGPFRDAAVPPIISEPFHLNPAVVESLVRSHPTLQTLRVFIGSVVVYIVVLFGREFEVFVGGTNADDAVVTVVAAMARRRKNPGM